MIDSALQTTVQSRSLLRSASRPGTSAEGAAGGAAQEEFELQGGYAFSQEEGGAVSQTEYIRRYDTTKRPKSGGGGEAGGESGGT